MKGERGGPGDFEAFADIAVGAGGGGRAKAGLGGAGEGGPDGLGGLELGEMRDEIPAEGGDINDEKFFRGAQANGLKRRKG